MKPIDSNNKTDSESVEHIATGIKTSFYSFSTFLLSATLIACSRTPSTLIRNINRSSLLVTGLASSYSLFCINQLPDGNYTFNDNNCHITKHTSAVHDCNRRGTEGMKR